MTVATVMGIDLRTVFRWIYRHGTKEVGDGWGPLQYGAELQYELAGIDQDQKTPQGISLFTLIDEYRWNSSVSLRDKSPQKPCVIVYEAIVNFRFFDYL